MSDYEVSLVNDNMQEFYVRFYGPAESEHTFCYYRWIWQRVTHLYPRLSSSPCNSTIRWWRMEDPC